jgi:hypothetical protein
MDRNFWHDLYPTSETRKRFSRSSALWIYLPIAAGALIAGVAAVAVLVFVPRDSSAAWAQWAQLATIILAAALLVTGFISWLVILASIWGLRDLLRALPDFTSRMRLRFIFGARSWKRGLNTVKRSAAAVSRVLSPDPHPGRPRVASKAGKPPERRAR